MAVPRVAGASVPEDHELLSSVARLLLVYVSVATLYATLAPFRFGVPEDFALDLGVSRLDLLRNVVLLMPAGYLLAASFPGRMSEARGLLFGVLASLLIEGAQWFLPDRHTSPWDIVCNASGAWVAVGAQRALSPWSQRWLARLVRRRSTAALGVVPVLALVALDALAAEADTKRLWLLLALGGFVVQASARWLRDPEGPREQRAAAVTAAFFVGASPALLFAPVTACGLTLAVGLAALRMARGRSMGGACSGKLAWSLLAVYVLGVAVWPMQQDFGQAASSLGSWLTGRVVAVLEYVLSFAVVGCLATMRPEASRHGASQWSSLAVALAVGAVLLGLALVLAMLRAHVAAQEVSLLSWSLPWLSGLWGVALGHRLDAWAGRRAGDGALARPLGVDAARA